MFYRHLLTDDAIYLYIGNFQEFSKEFLDVSKITKEQTIESLAHNYLKKHKIEKTPEKVFLVLDGIVIASLTLKNSVDHNRYLETSKYQEYLSDIDIANTKLATAKVIKLDAEPEEIIGHSLEEKKEKRPRQRLTDNIPSKKETPIYIPLLTNNKTSKIALEEYLVNVLASQIPVSFHQETLKALAVIIRTVVLKRLFEKKPFTPSINGLVYRTKQDLKGLWKDNYEQYITKIKECIEATKGEYIAHNNYFINAYYHYANNGFTEDSINVLGTSYPYLKVVNSPWDKTSSEYNRLTLKDTYMLSHLLGIEINNYTEIKVLEKTLGHNVAKIRIDNKIYDGKYLKDILSLRSADFDIEIKQNLVNITTRGFGHGLGLSLYGSDAMANDNYNYRQIINHYYPNTYIIKIII